jgi:hypothetical protein
MSFQHSSSFQVRGTNWVWRSSEQSIVNQQISVLGIAEVIVSTILYWWFAAVTPWPLLTLVAFLAVPLLLLRSPDSIIYGQELLNKYWKRPDEAEFSIKKFTLLSLPVVIVSTALVMSVMNQYIPNDSSGFAWAIRLASILGSFAFGLFAIGVVAGLGVFSGVGAGIFDDVDQFDGHQAFKSIAMIFLLLGLAVGLWIHATLIRFIATMRYFFQGLASFPINTRESTIVMDSFQFPQLIPGATKVHPFLSVTGLLELRVFKETLNKSTESALLRY